MPKRPATRRVRPNPRVKAPTNSPRDVSKHYAPATWDPRNTTSYWEHPPEEPNEERVSQLQLTAVSLWWDGATYEEIGRVLYDKDREHDPDGATKAGSIIQTAAKHFGVDVKDLKGAVMDRQLERIEDELRARGMHPEALLYEAMRNGRRLG